MLELLYLLFDFPKRLDLITYIEFWITQRLITRRYALPELWITKMFLVLGFLYYLKLILQYNSKVWIPQSSESYTWRSALNELSCHSNFCTPWTFVDILLENLCYSKHWITQEFLLSPYLKHHRCGYYLKLYVNVYHSIFVSLKICV